MQVKNSFERVAFEPAVAHAAVAVVLFERGEDPFDGGPAAFDQAVAALLPVGQAGQVLVPPVRDPVFDPARKRWRRRRFS